MEVAWIPVQKEMLQAATQALAEAIKAMNDYPGAWPGDTIISIEPVLTITQSFKLKLIPKGGRND